jgi:peptide-methionine (S)-S-oxide reductase
MLIKQFQKAIICSFFLGFLWPILSSCQTKKQNNTSDNLLKNKKEMTQINSNHLDTATFGGGCFWCTEAMFAELKGVVTATSGYSGGKEKNPSYKEVCSGTTGHAEVIQVIYDSSIISFDQLMEVFFLTHDPTTLNRQGNDVGTQYRSVVFYHNEKQKEIAAAKIKEVGLLGVYQDPIVTTLEPYTAFYSAEDYHQDYYAQNKNQPYCSLVINPKLAKFRKTFESLLK